MQFLQALRNAANRIESHIEDSNLFAHAGDRGEFRESIMQKFLRPYLPYCYGLASGAVFDENGVSSRQIDIVIYDEIFSNILFRNESNSLFPCEAVYGNIEVKSILTTEELNISVDNISSIKKLVRADSDMMDLLPFRRINLGAGLSYPETKCNPYLGILFAYDGLTEQTVLNNLTERMSSIHDKQELPDFVFNLKRQYMILRTKLQGTDAVPAPIGQDFDTFSYMQLGDDVLPIFFLTVNTVLNQLILRAPNFDQYWIRAVSAATQTQSDRAT